MKPVSVWDSDAVKELRGAVFRGDGSIVEVVRGRLNHEVLQLAGDGLVDAVVQGVPRAVELAEQCAAALRERAWEGDPELADQLQATLNLGPTPMLRPLAVDLEELASLLEGDPTRGGGRVDLKTGDCWPESLDHEDDGLDEEDEEDRWLYVDSLGAHEGYGDSGAVHRHGGGSSDRGPPRYCDTGEGRVPPVQRRSFAVARGVAAILPILR